MAARQKATDAEILAAYENTGSLTKAGEVLGINRASVHERLVKLGASKPINLFSSGEQERLRADYDRYVAAGQLDLLAKEMGRTKAFLCRQAGKLGLTDIGRTGKIAKEKRSAAARAAIARNGHPRGMLGKRHTAATKAVVSATSAARWANMTDDERYAATLKQMKAKVAKRGSLASNRPHGPWKAGWREIGGYRKYYRSRWEANYARYLQWLLNRGDILDWKHEPETFWFEAIKRGVRSYLPDFRVWELDGTSRLHEVKGWMDDRSRTTLKRMAKYYPAETIVLIKEREYRAIETKLGRLIEGWETAL